MPKKSRQDLLSDYIEKVDKCESWRDQESFEQTWRRLIDLYRGKHWPSTTSAQQDLIAVNLAFSTVNVIAPSVAVNYPKIVVQATDPEDINLFTSSSSNPKVSNISLECSPARAGGEVISFSVLLNLGAGAG